MDIAARRAGRARGCGSRLRSYGGPALCAGGGRQYYSGPWRLRPLNTKGTAMAQSNPLTVGLIGAGGRWGPWAHVPALTQLPETQLYAVCTAHADTAQAAADK